MLTLYDHHKKFEKSRNFDRKSKISLILLKEALKHLILWGGFRGSGGGLKYTFRIPKNSQNKLKNPSGLLPYRIFDLGPHFGKIDSEKIEKIFFKGIFKLFLLLF